MVRGNVTQPGYTVDGIDCADHLRLDEARIAELRARSQSRLLGLADLDPILDEEGRLHWAVMDEAQDSIFLGLDGDTPLFAPLLQLDALGQRGWSVFRLLALMSPRDAAIWGTARSLNEWHNRHRFCGFCGSPTASFRG